MPESKTMNNRYFRIFLWIGIASVLIFASIARGAVSIWSITPVYLITGFFVFIWLFAVNNSSIRPPLVRTATDIPAILFACLASASFLFSVSRNETIQALLKLFTYMGFYYLILNNFTFKMFKNMFILIIALGLSFSIYGILQFFDVFPHPWWNPKEFIAATYVNHNHFSGLLELIIPLTIGTGLESQKRNPVLAAITWFALFIMFAVFLAAQSRGAFLSLAISLSIMAFILLKRCLIKGISLISTCIFLTCGILSIYYLKPEAFKRLNLYSQLNKGEASIGTRILIWQGTVQMIREKPWTGTGLGTFRHGFTRFRPKGLTAIANFAHNDYLQVVSEIGIFSIPILIWLGLSLLWNGIIEKPDDIQSLGCCTGLLSLAFHGLIDFNFHIPANMLLCILFASYSSSQEGNLKYA